MAQMLKKHESQIGLIQAELDLERINCEDAQQKLKEANELVQDAAQIKELRRNQSVMEARERQHIRLVRCRRLLKIHVLIFNVRLNNCDKLHIQPKSWTKKWKS